jgi:hypothetical protein
VIKLAPRIEMVECAYRSATEGGQARGGSAIFVAPVTCSTALISWGAYLPASDRRRWCCLDRTFADGESAMKTIVSALMALWVLAGVAAPASAADDRWQPRDAGLSSPL